METRSNNSRSDRRSRRWRLLGLALLPSYLKNFGRARAARLRRREREFSFDDTPIFRFKVRLPRSIPCLTPPPSGFEDDGEVLAERRQAAEEHFDGDGCDDHNVPGGGEAEEEGDEIDERAEKFIVKFYEQMKLQRQISYLEYNEMLLRGMSC